MEMHENITLKHNKFGILGRPLGLPPRDMHFQKVFSGRTFRSQILCL